MPAGIFSRAALSSPTCLEAFQDTTSHLVGSPWEPLALPLSRARGSRAAAALVGPDAQLLQGGSRGGPPRIASSFKAKTPKEKLHDEEMSDSDKLEYRMRDGKKVFLSADDQESCEKDCKTKASPHKEDVSQASEGSASMAALGETPKLEYEECMTFCKNEFYRPSCFPGDSTVTVRDRGAVAMEEVRVGDSVLSVRPASNGLGWELCFEEVLAFLHREPETESDFVRVRHELGQVHLTGNHLLFAQSQSAGTSRAAAPIFAKEVCVGDRLLAPWIDGTLTSPKVLGVETVRKRGLYAPLLETGAFLVDGTAASCYAIPENLRESSVYKKLAEVASASSLQATYHTLFLPLRLACRAAAGLPQLAPMPGSEKLLTSKASMWVAQPKTGGPIHPYAWALYVMFSSLVA